MVRILYSDSIRTKLFKSFEVRLLRRLFDRGRLVSSKLVHHVIGGYAILDLPVLAFLLAFLVRSYDELLPSRPCK